MGYKPRERVALEWFIPIIGELLVLNELVTWSGNFVSILVWAQIHSLKYYKRLFPLLIRYYTNHWNLGVELY